MKSIKILDMHDSEICYVHFFNLGDWKRKLTIYIFCNAEKPMAEDEGFVVRLRGLPWAVTDEDILKFFGEKLFNSCITFSLI